jgi:hypothetical protein
LPELVDRAVDVAPLARDLDIGLIDLPAVTTAWPGGLGEQRGEALDPAVDGGVVDVNAALGEVASRERCKSTDAASSVSAC